MNGNQPEVRYCVAGSLTIAVKAVFADDGVHDLRIQTSTFGARLPLYGVARHAPATCRRAYVLDFGNTSAKRGRALYTESELTSIEELSSLPTKPRQPADLFEFMVETLADPQVEHDGVIRACIAAYMDDDGHVQPGQLGLYGPLATVTTNLSADLSAAVSARLGRTVRGSRPGAHLSAWPPAHRRAWTPRAATAACPVAPGCRWRDPGPTAA